MDEPGTLIKFGQYVHMLQLQDEGLLYMNNLPYFWEVEDEELRGDPFDSITEVRRGHKVVLPLPNGKEASMDGKWTMRVHPPKPERINIFCMYALRPLIVTFPLHDRNFRFGEYALVIINRPEFMRRTEATLKSQRIRAEADLVNYVDEEHTGEVGPFRKLKRFAYQSEWRLVCYDGPGGARQVRIGSIRDISALIRSDEVNNEIKIEFKTGGALAHSQ